MALPSLKQTIRDPGLGLVAAGAALLCFMGTCEKGVANTVYPITSPAMAVDTLGRGPLTEDVTHALVTAGGPVLAVKLSGSVAGSSGSVTPTRTSTSTGTVTVGGTPLDALEVRIAVTATGALGVGQFQYSLDDGRTYSDVYTLPSGGSFPLPGTGLTLTFVPGAGPITFERGDVHAFVTVAPHYGATDIANGFTGLVTYMSTAPELIVEGVVLSGAFATGAASATAFATLSTQLTALETSFRYAWGLIDGGNDGVSNVKTAYASVTSSRCVVAYGKSDTTSGAAMAGFSAPKGQIVRNIAARAARALLSEDLARVASGPLPGVLEVSHDEYVQASMDDSRFTTLRTWPLKQGYYVGNARMKSAPGSDYLYLQHRRVMDQACRTAAESVLQFSSAEFLTNKDGTIDASEAANVEGVVSSALGDALLNPKNASGKAGHVSALKYTVDRTVNLNTTGKLVTKVAIRPLGYAKDIEQELGFAVNVGA